MTNPKKIGDYSDLREAIKRKDKIAAKNLILNNVPVNNHRSKYNTPLHWAITQFEDLEIITMLLDKGANIYAKNQNNEKPLDIAIQKNKIQVAILLIERGALKGEDLNAYLLKAIEKNNYTLCKVIINNGLRYNPFNDFKIPLNTAICGGQLEIIEYILPYCQFLHPSDRYIPREIVKSNQNYKECVELLLKWNFTVDPSSNRDGDFIHASVRKGYLPIVLQLFELGINVNSVNPKTGLNLLKLACLNKHHEIAEILLKYNASVNDVTFTNTEILNDLLHYYKNIDGSNQSSSSMYNEKDFRGITCLHIAVLNADPILTRLLLNYGAKIIDDPKFFNITCIAVQVNCEEIVRIFLDQGVDVTDSDFQGNSLLHYCVNTRGNGQDSRFSITQLLLERGAAIHLQTPNNSLIFEAIKNKHPETVHLFFDYNSNIEYISPNGDTPLHKAIENNFDVEFIKILLKLNIPVDAINNNMLTPLLVACKTESTNQLETLETLLLYNANVNYAISSVNTNLAAHQENSPEYESQVNDVNNEGQTPLHFACKYKNDMTANVIELLLEHNANIEAVDVKCWTPLFVACEVANDIAVKCLLDHHAEINCRDLENLTPLYIAAKNCKNNSEAVKLLLMHKVDIDCMDKQWKSIIHLIVENDNAELIKFLAHTQINFNSIDKEGDTPLHIAVKSQRVDVTKELIKYGANVNILDRKNQTPLQSAMKYMSYCQSELDSYRDDRDDWYYRYSPYSSDEDSCDIDACKNKINACEKIIKVLKIHVLKLKIARLTVNKQNLKVVYNCGCSNRYRSSNHDDKYDTIDIVEIEEDCEQEIEQMRMEKIDVYNITLYDLLKKKIHFLSRFVKDKKIQQTLERKVYDRKFPIYMDIIRSRFRDAKLRYKLMKSAKKYFHLNVCPQLSDDCIDSIFSYLNCIEINIFTLAMELSNEWFYLKKKIKHE